MRREENTDTERRVCFIDNFDSFTYNLVEYVSQHAATEVVRNTVSLDDVRALDPDAIVISPGPGHPKNDRDIGVTRDVLTEVSPTVPTLGICLGLEAAVFAHGGTVDHAPQPVHGKAFPIEHDNKGVFEGLSNPIRGGRYHSLVATEVPACFEVTATTAEETEGTSDLVMGVRHREHPIRCVQFHPESVLTNAGHEIVRNFLKSV